MMLFCDCLDSGWVNGKYNGVYKYYLFIYLLNKEYCIMYNVFVFVQCIKKVNFYSIIEIKYYKVMVYLYKFVILVFNIYRKEICDVLYWSIWQLKEYG